MLTSLVVKIVLLLGIMDGVRGETYNVSLCTDIKIGELHYYINSADDNANLEKVENGERIVYNLCKQVEVYCPYLNAVLNSSLILLSPSLKNCISYVQSSVALIDPNSVSSGILVTYSTLSSSNQTINMRY